MEEGELFLKKYRIGKLLGEGAMGVVYAAIQEPSGLPVAIKFVSAKNVSARNINGERLVREAKVLARLNHGNLVRLHDFDKTADGDYFIVMELVEGDNLRSLLKRARKEGKVLEPQHVLHIMLQVAEGVGAAHRAGIVHRDLKPENIIVSEGRVVRVVDFGLAKNPGAGAAPPSGIETNPANVVGTPRYMAPEQVRGGEVDARADIFAIGVTMYEALTGRFPFDREGDDDLGETEVFARQCFAEATPLCEYEPNLPESLAKIVLRCLAKAAADRYQTARELARDIRAAIADEVSAQQQREQKPTAANDARETEPIPPQWAPGAVLPFAPPSLASAAPAAAHVVRETMPMSPPGPAGTPQPTYAARQPAVVGRGVGYTTKMQRPSTAALAAAEEDVARERSAGSPVPSADSRPPTDPPRSGPVVRAGNVEGVSEQPSRPSAASTSGVHTRQEQPTSAQAVPTGTHASLDRGSEPHAMSHQQSLSGASIPQQIPASRGRILGVSPLFAAPIVGSALAALALVVFVLLRGPGKHVAPHGATTTASVPAPPPPQTATVQEAPTDNVSAVPPSAAPAAGVPSATQEPTSEGTADTAAPTAPPPAPTPKPKAAAPKRSDPEPFARKADQPKPLHPASGGEREPPAKAAPAPAPTSHRVFGVEQ